MIWESNMPKEKKVPVKEAEMHRSHTSFPWTGRETMPSLQELTCIEATPSSLALIQRPCLLYKK